MDTESDNSEFNFNWYSHQLIDSEIIAYFIGSIIGRIFSVLIYWLVQFYFINIVVIDNSWSVYFIFDFIIEYSNIQKIK